MIAETAIATRPEIAPTAPAAASVPLDLSGDDYASAVLDDLREQSEQMTLAQRNEAARWEAECEAIRTGERGPVVPALLTASLLFGVSLGTVKRRYYAWVSKRDWRVFIDGRARTGRTGLPSEFLEFWRGLCLENRRKCAPAWRKLITAWRTGKPIPGYGTWQQYWANQGVVTDVCPPELPRGWTQTNLLRLRPSKAELKLARQGIAAAAADLPHVIGTREGMRPLEYVAFDDVELDFLCMVPGVPQPAKLRALIAKDVSCDMVLAFVLRPALEREDGTQDSLKARDMKRLIARLLIHHGMPREYQSHWIVERGTATVYPPDEIALSQISRGTIVIERTGMINGRVLYGDVADKAIGNPRAKAWIESGFNLLHNETADLPGHKGRRYDLAPRRLEIAKARAADLVKAGAALPAELRAVLQLPFPDVHEAHQRITEALLRIARHEDHACEGFQPVARWRLLKGDAWHTEAELLDLPEPMQAHIRAAGEWHQRIESRIERWHRLGGPTCSVRIPPSAVYPWLQTHTLVAVKKHMIQFDHAGRTYSYFRAGDALLMEGAKYLGWFDPDYPDKLHLTVGEGAGAKYVGWLPQHRAVRRGDQAAVREATAAKQRALAAALREVNAADEAIGGRAAREAALDANVDALAEGAALLGADLADTAPDADEADPAPVVVSMLDEQRASDRRAADLAQVAPADADSEWTSAAVADLFKT